MMIHWAWLIPAFYGGALCGVLLLCIFLSGKRPVMQTSEVSKTSEVLTSQQPLKGAKP